MTFNLVCLADRMFFLSKYIIFVTKHFWRKRKIEPFGNKSIKFYVNIVALIPLTVSLFENVNSDCTNLLIFLTDAASILNVTNVVMVGEKESATLECTVDGNPLSTEHVTWKRAGFSMEKRANFSFNNITSSLTIKDVTVDDMGSFYCVVDNGIGNESSKPAFLVVKREYF